MKFSKNTLNILKNFSSINDHLWFRSEGYLITLTKQQYNMVAIAKIPEEIPVEFGIYSLSRFLGVLSLFDHDSYEINLVNKILVLTEGDRQQLKYGTAEKKVLDLGPRSAPNGEVKGVNFTQPILAEFQLPANALKRTLSVSNVMSTFDKIGIKGENGHVTLNALNSQDPSTELFSYRAGDTPQTFNVTFPMDLFQKLMENDTYIVKVAAKIAEFTGSHVTYYLTPDANS